MNVRYMNWDNLEDAKHKALTESIPQYFTLQGDILWLDLQKFVERLRNRWLDLITNFSIQCFLKIFRSFQSPNWLSGKYLEYLIY